MIGLSRIGRCIFVFIVFSVLSFQIELDPISMQIKPGRLSHVLICLGYIILYHKSLWSYLCRADYYNRLSISAWLIYFSFIWGLIVVIFRIGDLAYYRNGFFVLIGYSILYLAILLMIKRVLKLKNIFYIFVSYFAYVQCLYVLISVIFIIFPSIREWWFTLLVQNDYYQQLIKSYITRVGIHGFSGFAETVTCSIGILFSVYLYSSTKCKRYLLCIIILLLGNFLYGRYGIVYSFLILFWYFIRGMLSRQWLSYLFFTAFSFLLFYCVYNYALETPRLSSAVQWILEPYEAFWRAWERGQISFGLSGDILLKRMYFFPDDLVTLFVGDGRYTGETGNSYYMHTDAGLMRHLLFYGIIGELSLYISLIAVLWNLYGISRYYNDLAGCRLAVGFLIATFFFEIKGTPIFHLWSLAFSLCIGRAMEGISLKTSHSVDDLYKLSKQDMKTI